MAVQRSPKTAVARLLGTCPQPVYALDDRRRIAYVNPALTEWLGVGAPLLLGQRCDYHSGGESGPPTAIAAGLCPPPEVFLGHRAAAEVGFRDAAGRPQRRRAEFLPLAGPTPDRWAVLALVDSENLPDAPAAPLPVETLATNPAALHARLRGLLHQLLPRYRLNQVVGESPAMVRVREQIRLASAGRPRVVVVGPPGSGRESIARAIHYGGAAANVPPLAPLACHLLDPELLQTTVASFVASCAELVIEQPPALLLLEVDQLGPETQAALAGMLNIREFNLRTLATARVSLTALAAENRFRPDLACALSTLVIEVPPLAERPQDIPLLAQLFLEQRNAAGGQQLAGFTAEAVDQLLAYPWPGNGDELAELVRQASAQATGPLVPAAALPEKIRLTAAAAAHPPRDDERVVLDEFLAEIEQELLGRALQRAKGNKAHAARLLGIPRARLLRRMEHFGLS